MIKSELSSRSRSKTRKLEDAPRTRRAGDDDASLYTVRLRIPYTHHADQTFLTMISRTNLLLSGTYVLGCCSNELLRTNSHQPHLSLTNPTSLSLSLSLSWRSRRRERAGNRKPRLPESRWSSRHHRGLDRYVQLSHTLYVPPTHRESNPRQASPVPRGRRTSGFRAQNESGSLLRTAWSPRR